LRVNVPTRPDPLPGAAGTGAAAARGATGSLQLGHRRPPLRNRPSQRQERGGAGLIRRAAPAATLGGTARTRRRRTITEAVRTARPAAWSDLVEDTVAVGGRLLRLARPRDLDALLDEQAFAGDEYLPYWAQLWPSALALARAVGARRSRGAAVLELGCGLGLPAIAAAAAGNRVLATDWSADAVAFTAANAARNRARLSTAVCAWERPAPLLALAPWDLVLAADVLYERRNAGLLLDLLPRLVGPGGEVWVADPGRPHTPAFLAGAAAAFQRRSTADPRVPGVTVHRLRRPGAQGGRNQKGLE
jgi:predicted nicotinamide N-methyase